MSMWILQTSETDESPLTFRLSSGAIKTIGRAPRADFIVDRALVSRFHCRLTAGDDKLEVEDLSSTNGTFVNDKRVAHAKIASGDRLRVGRIELRVERQGDTGSRL
jgi:pSer/pThr/pTyr-binding forkhead associated (FHA) protein